MKSPPFANGTLQACLPRVTHPARYPNWLHLAVCSLGSWLLTTAISASPGLGAERLLLVYGPLQFSLPVDALEAYAREGKVTDEFAFYARRFSPQQLAQLRYILQTPLQVNSTTVSQFTYSRIGTTVVERLGRVVQTPSGQSGFFALRAALILAAAKPEGLTLLNTLRKFPAAAVRIDLNRGLKLSREITRSRAIREAVILDLRQRSAVKSTEGSVDFSQQLDLRQPGPFQWRKTSFKLKDQARQRVFPADLYLPQGAGTVPVVVISHGAASDRFVFAYLAQHLASYGFAVAVLEHGDNAQRFRRFYAGFAKSPGPAELVDRPLDVTYLLDQLQHWSQSQKTWPGRLNLQQVGVIGHSVGGYTALALAGAKINLAQLRQDCRSSKTSNPFWNSSLLVQCEARRLPSTDNLQDKRVKAVIALNPLASSIFGKQSFSQLQVPVMLVASGADVFTPPVPEQIVPFTWLRTPHKYLVLVEKATHFSLLSPSPEGEGLPRLPTAFNTTSSASAQVYLKALSAAFAQTYLTDRPEYQVYLQAAYAKAISQSPLTLSLIQTLEASQLEQVLDATRFPRQRPKPRDKDIKNSR